MLTTQKRELDFRKESVNLLILGQRLIDSLDSMEEQGFPHTELKARAYSLAKCLGKTLEKIYSKQENQEITKVYDVNYIKLDEFLGQLNHG